MAFIFIVFFGFLKSAIASNVNVSYHFINVGKGDTSLIEFPCGAILIDAGGGVGSADDLIDYLDRFFLRRSDLNYTLDMVVLTHGHLDHTRNIKNILEKYYVKTVLTNGHFKKRGYKNLPILLLQHPNTVLITSDLEAIQTGGQWTSKSDPLDCDGQEEGEFPDIRIIWGDARPRLKNWGEHAYRDENNHSVSVLVRWGESKALFTGDLEKNGLEALLLRQHQLLKDVDLYHISHHGFRSGTATGFLEHINPQISILSRPVNRAWYEPTMNRFNRLVRLRREPITVPIWNYNSSSLANINEVDHIPTKTRYPGKPRFEKNGLLTGAIYWTGIDGTIWIEMTASGDVELKKIN